MELIFTESLIQTSPFSKLSDFLLAYINCTKGFHCNISIQVYDILFLFSHMYVVYFNHICLYQLYEVPNTSIFS